MEDDDLIARNVRLRMEAKELGPKALSLMAGLNETYVRDIPKGRSHNPRQSHLQRLAKALECRVSDLTGEALEPVPPSDIRRELFGLVEAMTEEQRHALLLVAKVLAPPEKPDVATPEPPTKPQPARRRVA